MGLILSVIGLDRQACKILCWYFVLISSPQDEMKEVGEEIEREQNAAYPPALVLYQIGLEQRVNNDRAQHKPRQIGEPVGEVCPDDKNPE